MAGRRIVVASRMPVLDLIGNPVPGALLRLYENQTTTLAPMFADAALTVPRANPIAADIAGNWPDLWAENGDAEDPTLYTVAITDADGVPIVTFDNFLLTVEDSAALSALTAVEAAAEAEENAALTVSDKLAAAASAAAAADSADEAAATVAAARIGPNARRKVPPGFVRGEGLTITSVFPDVVNYAGPGGGRMNKSPKDLFLAQAAVQSKLDEPPLCVDPLNGLSSNTGLTWDDPLDWETAYQDKSNLKLLVRNTGPISPLPLVNGTAASPTKWIVAVDGLVKMQADTSLGQPPGQTWTLESGSVYKTTLSSADLDRPQRILKLFVPNVIDGQPGSIQKYASVAELTALGSSGEGWYFNAGTDTLYMTYYGAVLSGAGARDGFHIVYSQKTLDTDGALGAELRLAGTTTLWEGDFFLDGIWVNNEEQSGSPSFYTEGNFVQLCPSSYGLHNEGFAYTDGRRCYRSRNDGTNGYGGSSSLVTMTIEVNGVCINTGDPDNYGPSPGFPANCQGSSAHGFNNAMRFFCLFESCFGQGVGDISSTGHVSCSWDVGVISRDNYADGGISNGFYYDSTGGGERRAWVDTCISEGNTRDLVVIGGDVFVYNSQLETQLILSGGTVSDYNPANP